MNDADRLREIFGPTDPVADDGYVADLDRRERMLRDILAGPPARARRPRRLALGPTGWVAAAASVVLVAITGIVVAVAFPPAAASAWATPAPLTSRLEDSAQPAAPRLHALAATVLHQSTASTGARDHLLIRSWALNSDIAGTTVTSVVIPTETEVWRDPDNAGTRTVAYLAPEAPTEAQLAAWNDEGSPGASEAATKDDYPAGQFVSVWTDRPPTAPDRLRDWLSATRQGTDPATTVVSGITDLLHERALTTAESAAALTLLADVPGLRYAGAITDRAGRAGDAYTVIIDGAAGGPGLPVTYTFVIDPGSGRVLAQERVLATEVGRLNVTAPAVIGYDTYLVSELA